MTDQPGHWSFLPRLRQSGRPAFLPVSDRLVAQESLLKQSAGWNVAASRKPGAPPPSPVCSSADLAWPVSLGRGVPSRRLLPSDEVRRTGRVPTQL
ncbi:MAG TPA: hypothetical protein VKB35_18225, partial [Ktedonobacteraceae bacterium]|nr:hypothetical protein [Ktedonobacteraceae bacterium]